MLAKWELVTDEKTGETKGRYRDDILGNFASIDNPNANPNPEIELEIYERSDKKGYYRMKAYTPELMNIFAGGQVKPREPQRLDLCRCLGSEQGLLSLPIDRSDPLCRYGRVVHRIANTGKISPWTNRPDNMARSRTA